MDGPNPASLPTVLTQGKKTERALFLMRGIIICPLQFRILAHGSYAPSLMQQKRAV